MKKWDEVIKEGLYMYVHKEGYAYFYGAKGQVLTENVMNALISAEPKYFARYNDQQLQNIKNYSRGKIGFDCSGFVGKLTGCNTYSGAQFEQCKNKTDLVHGLAGNLVWKPGHIGIDIGYGYFLDMPCEGQSVRLGKLSESTFQQSGSLVNYVNYEGANNR